MSKVVKFGGSSLADANQFRKVAEIINGDSERKFVIVSAPGKRFSDDIKVTDMLYSCYDDVLNGKDAVKSFAPIRDRFDAIIKDLGLELSLEEEYQIIIEQFENKAGVDYAASRGEYLSAKVLSKLLSFKFIDASKGIFFNKKGEFDSALTDACISEICKKAQKAVIPGFYGVLPNGKIKTFSRGGSDFTGSVIAKAIGADLYENWTDVSGFLAADPRIVKGPIGIKTITYRELRELSYMGAGVLHEDAIFPVRSANIPINIKNTNKPEDSGTMILPNGDDIKNEHIITGIAGKKGFSVIQIEKDRMNSRAGYLRRILQVLETHDIYPEHLPTGIDTLSIAVEGKKLEGKENIILEKLQQVANPDHLDISNNLSLIAVVGRGMRSTRGTATRIFAALSHANINIRMIDQGSSELNIIVGVEEDDFEKAIQVIYDMFILAEK